MTDEGQKAIEAATDQLVVRLETLFQWELNREHGRTLTRHIIRAYLAALPGWRLAPTEAKEDMLLAFWGPTKPAPDHAQSRWSNMLEFAPPPPGLED